VFPVSWNRSRIDGFTGRVNLVEHGGFSAFVVMAHTNAIYSPPGAGGILLEAPDGDFRIDHDQKFNATTNLQYAFEKTHGAWAALSWRYDSGLVAGSVASIGDALALTGDQQAAIGFFCGGAVATRDAPITSCSSGGGATRLRIPAEGTEDAVNNPPRIAPRHLFDIGLGVDNLFHSDKAKVRLRFSVINLTNKEALYNFLSTFSGTHFVTPRAYQVHLGVSF
jgi:TonB dependent receptor